MAHSYPTAHPDDQTPAMRVGVCHDRQRFYFAKGIDAQLPDRDGRFTVQFDDFRFRDIHIGTGFIDRFCGVVKFIQVFHVHIFNAEFMQSADAQMIQSLRPDTFIQQVIAGAVSRRKPPDRNTAVSFQPGGQRQKILAIFTVGNTVP